MTETALNPALLAAYAQDVTNWQIFGAMADDLDERDDPVAADAMRWLYAKRRHPEGGVWR